MNPNYNELWQWFEECYDQLRAFKIQPNEQIDYWIQVNYKLPGETPLSTAIMIKNKIL